MTRSVSIVVNEQLVERVMPSANEEILSGVTWGNPWTLFTPAYWLSQAWMAELDTKPSTWYRARDGLIEEIIFCLLGGFGISAETATLAYEQCKRAGLVAARETDVDAWRSVLSAPIHIDGRKIRYRYPNQKSKYLAAAMRTASQTTLCRHNGLELRNQLLDFAGVGHKTASWVVRNYLDSDDVAILDIHIIRAGKLCGLYSDSDRVERDYCSMEKKFLHFCKKMGIRPASLDCVIWDGMRKAGSLPLRMLEKVKPQVRPIRAKKSKIPQKQLCLLGA